MSRHSRSRRRGRPRHPDVLTPAEWRVLEHLREGASNAEIAGRLDVSINTVRTQVSSMLAKLDLPDRQALAAWPGEPAEATRRRLALSLALPGWLRWRWGDRAAGAGKAAGVVVAGALAALAVLAAIDASRDKGEPIAGAAASPTTSAAATAEPTPAPTPDTTPPRAVLTDGTGEYDYRPQLAYIDDSGDAWVVDADGDNPTLLIEGCGGTQHPKQGDVLLSGLVWSADGGRVACNTVDGGLLAAAADGTEHASLVPAGTWCAYPQWSPDGERVACIDPGQSGPTRLVIFEATGTEIARIQIGAVSFGAFAWSPSGRYLIYESALLVDRRAVWVLVDRNGVEVAQFERGAVGDASGFAWTRDGSALAFPTTSSISVSEFPSWRLRDLSVGDPWDASSAIAWALDGRALLLWAVDGFSPTRLVDSTTGAPLSESLSQSIMALAPDGHRAALMRSDSGTSVVSLSVVDLELGTEVMVGELIIEALGLGPAFVFSGDSSRLCWAPFIVAPGPVHCTDTDDPDPVEVTVPFQFTLEPPHGGQDYDRVWMSLSPDLTKVAYTVPGPDDPRASQVLWVADLDGSNAVEIGPAAGPYPFEWRPDGVWRP